MKRIARRPLMLCIVAAICVSAIFYFWVEGRGVTGNGMVAFAFAISPFVILALTGTFTKSGTVARASQMLVICFASFLALRLLLPVLRRTEEDWLLVSLFYIGIWELVLAGSVAVIMIAVEQRRTKRRG